MIRKYVQYFKNMLKYVKTGGGQVMLMLNKYCHQNNLQAKKF